MSNEELTERFTEDIKSFKNNTFTYTVRTNTKEKGETITNPKLEHIVQRFLDDICAKESSEGIGTDNMTCILVIVEN